MAVEKLHQEYRYTQPSTGVTWVVVNPGEGAGCFGVGHPGAVRYYRVSASRTWALKINKASVSAASVRELCEELALSAGRAMLPDRCRAIMERVRPCRNPFPAAYLATFPELAEGVA